ncbi:MAG: hypothetical protein WCK47_11095 [bacterium]|nr:hypothetical protein [Candidatus Sumerlaeota bacterium]
MNGMKDNRWVGLTVRTSIEAEEWFGELECSVDELLAMIDSQFVRMNHARWLESQSEYEEPNLVRNQDGDPPFEHYLYIRKSDISMIRPLRCPLRVTEDVE